VKSRDIFFGLTAGLCLAVVCGQPVQRAAAETGEIHAVLTGDYADPSIVRVGDDFYMTHSSSDYFPGLLIWRSRDLTRWERVGYALHKPVGDVWGPDLVYYKNKFYVYFPAARTVWVVTADRPEGPWSEPVDLELRGIDPGHIATPDGRRYLYVDNGRAVRLADNGLSISGGVRRVYEGWKYPEDWAVEGFYPESPKLVYKDKYYCLTTAEGGTAGPSTSHMVVSARSRNPLGAWKNSPFNPIVHTWSRSEKYWSKGHGTIFSDSAGRWYIVYHGYENGFYALGRNTLIEPIEWTKDGWFKTVRDRQNEGEVRRFGNVSIEADDFSGPSLKLQWQFSGIRGPQDYELKNGALTLNSALGNFRAVHCTVGDHGYEASVRIETGGDVEAGLAAYYSGRMFAGIGIKSGTVVPYAKGTAPAAGKNKNPRVRFLKLRMRDFDLQRFFSEDGKAWTAYPSSVDVAGYNHNVLGGFSSLKLGVFVRGEGQVRVDDFNYRPLY